MHLLAKMNTIIMWSLMWTYWTECEWVNGKLNVITMWPSSLLRLYIHSCIRKARKVVSRSSNRITVRILVTRNRMWIAQLDGTADHFVTAFFFVKHLRMQQHNGCFVRKLSNRALLNGQHWFVIHHYSLLLIIVVCDFGICYWVRYLCLSVSRSS